MSAKRFTPGGVGRPAVGRLLALALAVILSLPIPASAALVVRRGGSGGMAQIADALEKALERKPSGKKPHVVELSGDSAADSARLAREAEGETVVFAIGAEAVTTAGGLEGFTVVALAVPNPAKMKTPGTYISVYPKLDQVFEFLQKKLKAKEVGLLYSSSQNTEIALSFKKAADAHGVVLHPLSVASAGDLARALKQSLPKIDALVLAVDPILFDRQNLKSIVAEATAAKKPTIGFLEGLPALGVTVTLLSDPAAAAAAAVAAAESPAAAGKKTVDVESSVVIFSRKSAQAIGIDAEASGATKIE